MITNKFYYKAKTLIPNIIQLPSYKRFDQWTDELF